MFFFFFFFFFIVLSLLMAETEQGSALKKGTKPFHDYFVMQQILM